MLRISNHYVSRVVFLLLFFELLILIASAYAGAALRVYDDGQPAILQLDNFLISALAFAVAIVFSMSALGMYQLNLADGLRNPFFQKLVPAFALGFCILTLLFYIAPHLYFGRGIMLFVFLIGASGIFLARTIFFKTSEARILETRILFVGGGPLANECRELAIRNHMYHRYDIAGFIAMASEDTKVPQTDVIQMSRDDSLLSLARRYDVEEIVVSVENRRGGAFPIKELLECKLYGVKVIDAATFFERETSQIRVDSLQPSWLVFGGGFDQSFIRTFVKRTFDLVCSALILLVSLPVMLLTALAIYIEDRNPIFYSQERVGKNGQTFKVLKFRSMFNDAEKGGKPQWAAQNDPRVTRVGNFIRKCRIDELPQILNVFKGEMSFVGPRPERPYFVGQLSEQVPYYNVRHSIKPGITGWAQVRYGYGASVDDALQKLQYDLYYVKNNSLFLDLLILIDTMKVVMGSAGR